MGKGTNLTAGSKGCFPHKTRWEQKHVTLADMLSSMRTGDVILFEAGLSGGCYHSGRIASVGVVYHGASVLPAQTKSGKRMMLRLEAPHLLEATGSHCVGSPIEQAVKGAFADGIGVYWRPIRRRALKGEPRDELDKPLPIPRKLCRVGAASDSFEMPGGYDWDSVDLKYANWDNVEEAGMAFTVDLFREDSAEGVELFNKLVACQNVREPLRESQEFPNEVQQIENCWQLKNALTHREWSQQCVNMTRNKAKPCEPVSDASMSSSKCWPPGLCSQGRAAGPRLDSRSQKDKLASDLGDAYFSSQIVALQMLRAGWRKGTEMSDMYEPEDFADLPEEHLSQDLHHHVRLGPMVRVHISEIEMEQAMSNSSPNACYHSAAASRSPSLEVRPLARSSSHEASSGAAENTPLIARA